VEINHKKLHHNAKDKSGLRFGKLKVLEVFGVAPDRQLTWLCLCDCGDHSIVKSGNLSSGTSKSCGCLRGSEDTKQKISKSRKGKCVGSLNPVWRGGLPKCKDCGKTIAYQSTRCTRCYGKTRTGNNHHNWKNGATPENKRIRLTMEYKQWRKAVFERDNYTCVWCGIRSKQGQSVELHADHIKPFALFPELRLELSNGRTLCIDCHKKTDTYLSKMLLK
jgi:hypothetical protein